MRILTTRLVVAVAVAAGLGLTPPVAAGSTHAAATRVAVSVAVASGAVTDGRIVYGNQDTGQLETINPDGTARVEVTHADVNIMPAWTPDGGRILYSSNAGGDDFHLFSVKPDGTDVRQLTTEAPGFSDFQPAMTPDGSRVIFTRCRPDPPGGCALFSVRADGSARHLVTRFGSDSNDDFADVSPNGRRLAFTRFGEGGELARIWVAHLDGSRPHPVTTARLEAGSPRWTPDGHHLIVNSAFLHLGESLFRVAGRRSHGIRLTAHRFPRNDVFGEPSPSGSRIVFGSDRAAADLFRTDLFVMRADGTHEHPITHDSFLIDPDWGTAPLLPASRATARASLAPPLDRSDRATLDRVLRLTRGEGPLSPSSEMRHTQ